MRFRDVFQRYDTQRRGSLSPADLARLIRDVLNEATDAQIKFFMVRGRAGLRMCRLRSWPASARLWAATHKALGALRTHSIGVCVPQLPCARVRLRLVICVPGQATSMFAHSTAAGREARAVLVCQQPASSAPMPLDEGGTKPLGACRTDQALRGCPASRIQAVEQTTTAPLATHTSLPRLSHCAPSGAPHRSPPRPPDPFRR